MTGQFVVGLVGIPFGLKGFVKVRPLSGESAHIRRLGSVLLRKGLSEQTYEVEETAGSGAVLMMKFRGIDTPEAAKALTGAELVTDRVHAAPLKEGEFYIEDLRGIPVTLQTGETVGEITDVLEGGGGFLVEVRLPAGELRLIPFRNEFFGEVDPEKQRVLLLARWILE
ncbi:ribosome maturation factor RimM [Treponema sp. TIM-1]|uniref:ribosome maturation factor RimM n=1 Tax=Treponema sp. TIM-1 TaxID=2898417 RepID=UPI00397ED1CE